MNIDKSKLRLGIWYEDKNGNYISYDDPSVPEPDNAYTRHVSFPLEVQERIYFIRDKEGNLVDDPGSVTFNVHIGSRNEDVILAMVNSGDYSLSEAIAVYSSACERCANVLAYKYLNGCDGYEEFSDEWFRCNTCCDFCKGE